MEIKLIFDEKGHTLEYIIETYLLKTNITDINLEKEKH